MVAGPGGDQRHEASVRLKAEIDSTLQTGESVVGSTEPPMVGFVGRLARYMLQVPIEAEATAFVGREHYRRGARQRAGWRNGTRQSTFRRKPASGRSRCRSCAGRRSHLSRK